MSSSPGVGWANLPKPPPAPKAKTGRRRSTRLPKKASPLPAAPSPSEPAEEAENLRGGASNDEEAEAAADEPVADPPTVDTDTNNSQNDGDATAAADGDDPADQNAGTNQQPEGDGAETPPPPLAERQDDDDDGGSNSEDDDDAGTEEIELDPERELDLLLQTMHEADRRLIEVYGDTVHRNDGRNLHGGVGDDEAVCMLYDRIVDYPHPMYSPPKGKVGDRFLLGFAKELKKVRERESNSERALIFPCVILRKEPGIRKAKAIRKRIMRRLDHWNKGLLAELVQDTVATARRGQGGGARNDDDESIARRYHSMVIAGKLRAGVRMVTSRDGGGGIAS